MYEGGRGVPWGGSCCRGRVVGGRGQKTPKKNSQTRGGDREEKKKRGVEKKGVAGLENTEKKHKDRKKRNTRLELKKRKKRVNRKRDRKTPETGKARRKKGGGERQAGEKAK